jgi:hypothetical protein
MERVEAMSEEEAAELLAQLEWESSEVEEMTPEEERRVRRGLAQIARGESIDGEALLKELGL